MFAKIFDILNSKKFNYIHVFVAVCKVKLKVACNDFDSTL